MNKPLNIVIRDTDYRFGDGKIPVKLRGLTTTDWASHFEFQVWQLLKNGDTDDCWDFGGIKGVDAFMDALIPVMPIAVTQQIADWGFMDTGIDGKLHFHSSPRFPGVMTGIGQNGASEQTELDFSKTSGLVPFTMLPVTPDMTIAEYFDPTAITQEMKDIALAFRNLMGGKDFILYQWVNDGGATNLAKMAAAQPAGPFSLGIPVSSTGWNQVRPTPATGTPVHVVSGMSVDLPNSDVYISDNYAPFNKILGKGQQISYVLQIIVQYIPPPPAPLPPSVLPTNPDTVANISAWQAFLTALTNWLERLSPQGRAKLGGASRSPLWSGVEKAFVAQHPVCEVCGTKNKRQVHHISPFHLDPAKELDPENLITLCQPHHLLFGHFMNWKSFDKDVRANAALWKTLIDSRP